MSSTHRATRFPQRGLHPLLALLAAGGLHQLTTGEATAQFNQPATTVQLPSYNVFSVNTTVSVPDRGSISLGGVSRAREGSVSRGVPLLGGPAFDNRGIGREVSKSTLRAHVHVIDLDELDREVLAAARAGRSAGVGAGGGAAAGVSPQQWELALRLTRHMGRRPSASQSSLAGRP